VLGRRILAEVRHAVSPFAARCTLGAVESEGSYRLREHFQDVEAELARLEAQAAALFVGLGHRAFFPVGRLRDFVFAFALAVVRMSVLSL
jgi:hypothetical protein